LWLLGYTESALADANQALSDAREIDQAATSMYALTIARLTDVFCGNYVAANAQTDEVISLADEKGALFWKAFGMMNRGWLLALTGKAPEAVRVITSGITAWRSTGAAAWMPLYLSYLARSYAELGQFDEAWHCIGEAITATETTQERWCEANVHRIAGEIALMARESDATKAESFFERALAIAREQQARSWELRAAVSMARLWRDQRKLHEAHELLAPVYGWFTEGLRTHDLKEAKALLDSLGS
jgi:predicted ATPase